MIDVGQSTTRRIDTPLILHRCPHCSRLFDSPSVCMPSGTQTEPFVRTIRLAIWKALPAGEPQGVGLADEDVDATILVDFDSGTAHVYPTIKALGAGGLSSSGPPKTPGLNLNVSAVKA